MKKHIALLGLLGLAASFNINAALLQDQQPQSVDGQLFAHILAGPVSNGTGGVLTVTARGDFYSGGQFDENYTVSIDGNLLGSELSYDSSGAYSVTEYSFNDHEFSFDFALSPTLMSAVMADMLALVTVDFGSGVNNFNSSSYSAVSLSYNNSSVGEVPIPAAAFLFAPALLGFVGLRRKAKNNVA